MVAEHRSRAPPDAFAMAQRLAFDPQRTRLRRAAGTHDLQDSSDAFTNSTSLGPLLKDMGVARVRLPSPTAQALSFLGCKMLARGSADICDGPSN